MNLVKAPQKFQYMLRKHLLFSPTPATTKEANYSDTSGLIEPRSSLHTRYNLAGATTVVRVSASSLLPFRLINPTSEPIKIYQHTRLGTFLPECDHVADISVLSSDKKILQHPTSYQTNNDMPHTDANYNISSDLLPAQAAQLRTFLDQNQDIFAKSNFDLGRTSVVKHDISTDGSTQPTTMPKEHVTNDLDAHAPRSALPEPVDTDVFEIKKNLNTRK